MQGDGRTPGITIERGIVKEKKIPDNCYWWVYRVESVTRDGLKSLWMESIDVWEHVRDPDIPYGGNQTGYAVGTKVYFFLFEDGRGMILNRIEDETDDFKARIGVFAKTMAKVIEKEDQILAGIAEIKAMIAGSGTGSIAYGLSSLSTQISNAQSEIDGRVDGAKSSIEGKISDIQGSIEGKVDGAQSSIEGKVDGAKSSIEGKVDSAKSSIEGKIAEVKAVDDQIKAKVDTL